mmetsp:Transcript_58117/g.168712  ORF Transcript_58117/g.168712 Transcript_58117/m.168712 type:complete len:246 (+) Transcript_58117:1070-1807(+)
MAGPFAHTSRCGPATVDDVSTATKLVQGLASCKRVANVTAHCSAAERSALGKALAWLRCKASPIKRLPAAACKWRPAGEIATGKQTDVVRPHGSRMETAMFRGAWGPTIAAPGVKSAATTTPSLCKSAPLQSSLAKPDGKVYSAWVPFGQATPNTRAGVGSNARRNCLITFASNRSAPETNSAVPLPASAKPSTRLCDTLLPRPTVNIAARSACSRASDKTLEVLLTSPSVSTMSRRSAPGEDDC